MRTLVLLCLSSILLTLCNAGATVYTPTISLPKTRTLVLLQDTEDKQRYSTYFESLESFLDVTYETSSVDIRKYGEYLYDNIIILGVQRDLNVKILDFVDAGGNVMIVARPLDGDPEEALPEKLREAAIDCGVLFSETNVVDFFNKNEHGVVSGDIIKSKPIFPKELKSISYHGLGIKLESNNPLLIPIATARKTAYTSPVGEGEDEMELPQMIGNGVVLVAGLQTRLGSRMTFIGSNNIFKNDNKENLEFVRELTKWNFQLRGVLRYSNVQHGKVQADEKTVYRIREDLFYTVKVEEFVENKWVPFKTDDLQLEFTMIDPYIRQSLKYDDKKNDGTYYLEFRAPDVYGIYKFLVDYRRPGYAPLIFFNQTTVRPLKLNEYERFIPSAYPYYAAVFVLLVSFNLFGFLFLYTKE